MGFIIVLAAPVFFLAIAIEWWWGWRLSKRGQLSAQTYRLDDAINSISLGIISQLSAVFTRVFRITIYTLVFEQVAVFDNPDFWQSVLGACLALVLYDFCYYWYHRASHEVAFFWGGHVVHHQSQHYNLSTALRQTTSGGGHRLGVLLAHGGLGRAPVGVWHRGLDRFALPVLGAHRARGQTGLV